MTDTDASNQPQNDAESPGLLATINPFVAARQKSMTDEERQAVQLALSNRPPPDPEALLKALGSRHGDDPELANLERDIIDHLGDLELEP